MAKKRKKKTKKTPSLRKHIIGKNTVLYKTAEKAGFTPEQISGFDSEESLKEAVRSVKPILIAEMESKHQASSKKSLPKPKEPPLEDKVFTFTVDIDLHRTQAASHAAMEEMQIQSILRSKYIKNIQTVSIVRSLVPDKKQKLVSQVTVNYKG